MQVIDWVIVGLIAVSTLISVKRGFVKEALSLAAWVLAAVISFTYRDKVAYLLIDTIELPILRNVAAGAILFITTLLVASLLNVVLSQLIKATGLSGTDRVLGMVFGFFRGLIIIMVLLILLPPVLQFDQQIWWQQSVLVPHLQTLESGMVQIGNELLGKVVQATGQEG